MRKVSVETFETEISQPKKVQLVDVREPSEYGSERIAGSANLALSRLDEEAASPLSKQETLYVVCRSGARACQAAERFEKMGFQDVRVLEGGLTAWAAAGRAVEKGASKVWSLERQVRFTAGLLVLAGAGLSAAVHPYWIGLSAFVGAGLVFAAVTDTCGMAMMLARMPWNQTPAPAAPKASCSIRR